MMWAGSTTDTINPSTLNPERQSDAHNQGRQTTQKKHTPFHNINTSYKNRFPKAVYTKGQKLANGTEEAQVTAP